jgi:hypothetical protein
MIQILREFNTGEDFSMLIERRLGAWDITYALCNLLWFVADAKHSHAVAQKIVGVVRKRVASKQTAAVSSMHAAAALVEAQATAAAAVTTGHKSHAKGNHSLCIEP